MLSTFLLLPSILLLALQPISRACNEVQPCGILLLIYLSIFIGTLVYSWRRISIFLLIAVLALYAQWGVMQFAVQRDLGFQYIGESRIASDVPGVAKFSIGSEKVIRSYGPFLHANIFGGAMLCGLILVLAFAPGAWRRYLLPLFLLAIAVSFSRSAYMGVPIALLFVSHSRVKQVFIIMSVIFVALSPLIALRISDNESNAVGERLHGYQWAKAILSEQQLTQGAGIGLYVARLDTYLTIQ